MLDLFDGMIPRHYMARTRGSLVSSGSRRSKKRVHHRRRCSKAAVAGQALTRVNWQALEEVLLLLLDGLDLLALGREPVVELPVDEAVLGFLAGEVAHLGLQLGIDHVVLELAHAGDGFSPCGSRVGDRVEEAS